MKRKIAVFTGNRAEYGLQYPLLCAIRNHPKLDYQLIVSGAHLDPNFGNTLKEIQDDGFVITKEIKIFTDSKSSLSQTKAIGEAIEKIGEALCVIKPDFFVVYADRFEGFAATIAATQLNIPTAHVEGGDLTEGGALDDSMRHAMTKLSHIHFTTNLPAARRVIGMGEEAWRVHNVGLPSIDLIINRNFATMDEVKKKLRLDLEKPIILFTQHPITTEAEQIPYQLEPSLEALDALSTEGIQVVVTYPNNDVGSDFIVRRFEKIEPLVDSNIQLHKSLGRYYYHGVLALAESDFCKVVCVGNSSSGIKETGVFGCPAVNIGSRQHNRLRGDNVIDVNYDKKEIIEAVKFALTDVDFRTKCRRARNPYGDGKAGEKMASLLATIELNKSLIQKKMTILAPEN